MATLHRPKPPVRAALVLSHQVATGIHVPLSRAAGSILIARWFACTRCGLLPPPQVRVVWMKDTRRNPDGGGLLMSQPRMDLNVPSRPCPPGRPATNASASAVSAPSLVGRAEGRQSVDASAGTGRRSRGRSGCTDPPGVASTPSPRQSSAAAANHARFGVRRPIIAPMPADRREQAVAALAHLLIVQLERQVRQPDPDVHGRGRVAGSGSEQEEEP
jgi:hypothetical protein